MARRDELVEYANQLLEVDKYPEFGPPGLQVVGADDVRKLVCGVSSSLELFARAAEARAQLVLVHHGLFWRNEPLVVERRMRARLQALFDADLTLLAYHIALDAHRELGNNAQLATRLGVVRERDFAGIGLGGRLRDPQPLHAFVARVRDALGREPVVFAEGPDEVERVAISSGSSGHDLVRAAIDGYDLLLTGEAEEPNLHSARELGIHVVAGGHYATERYGVQALAAHLAQRFGLEWEFIEVENPI